MSFTNVATAAAVQRRARYRVHAPLIASSKAQIVQRGSAGAKKVVSRAEMTNDKCRMQNAECRMPNANVERACRDTVPPRSDWRSLSLADR